MAFHLWHFLVPLPSYFIGKKNPSFLWVNVAVDLHAQPDVVLTHLGYTPLVMPMRVFLEKMNCGKNPPSIGNTVPWTEMKRNNRESRLNTSVHVSLLPDCDII